MEENKPKESRLSEEGMQMIFEMRKRAKAKGPSQPDQGIPLQPHVTPNT